ncbi:MAG: ATP synthase F1 subunit delta [Elusimicrobiota bacterium]
MRNPTVSKRYAKALFELATINKALDDVLLGFGNLVFSIKESKDFAKILANPLVKTDDKIKLVVSITSNKMVMKLVEILSKRHRLVLLMEIYEQLKKITDDSNGIHHAFIKSAVTLSGDEKVRVEQKLKEVFGGKVVGQFHVDQELIGGIWIESAGKVLDATVKGRIDTFRHALLHSAN